jgi:hypothetical protein
MEAAMDRPTAQPPPSEGDGEAGGGWQQQAGFSVFFDRRSNSDAVEWRTRLYHDEADDATSILGLDPGGWIPWIVERLPATDRQNARRLLGVEVCGVKAVPSTGEHPGSGYFEIGLRIDGLSELGQAVGAAVIAAALSALASSSTGESRLGDAPL